MKSKEIAANYLRKPLVALTFLVSSYLITGCTDYSVTKKIENNPIVKSELPSDIEGHIRRYMVEGNIEEEQYGLVYKCFNEEAKVLINKAMEEKLVFGSELPVGINQYLKKYMSEVNISSEYYNLVRACFDDKVRAWLMNAPDIDTKMPIDTGITINKFMDGEKISLEYWMFVKEDIERRTHGNKSIHVGDYDRSKGYNYDTFGCDLLRKMSPKERAEYEQMNKWRRLSDEQDSLDKAEFKRVMNLLIERELDSAKPKN